MEERKTGSRSKTYQVIRGKSAHDVSSVDHELGMAQNFFGIECAVRGGPSEDADFCSVRFNFVFKHALFLQRYPESFSVGILLNTYPGVWYLVGDRTADR